MNFLELVAACVPVLVWSPLFCNTEVVILSDNIATVSFTSRGTTENLPALKWLKLLFYAGCTFNFFVSARDTPEVANIAADALGGLLVSPSFEKIFEGTRKSFPSCAKITPDSVYRFPNAGSVDAPDKVAVFRVGQNVVARSKKSVEQILCLLRKVRAGTHSSLYQNYLSLHRLFVEKYGI